MSNSRKAFEAVAWSTNMAFHYEIEALRALAGRLGKLIRCTSCRGDDV